MTNSRNMNENAEKGGAANILGYGFLYYCQKSLSTEFPVKFVSLARDVQKTVRFLWDIFNCIFLSKSSSTDDIRGFGVWALSLL